jgi:hypothetical protein
MNSFVILFSCCLILLFNQCSPNTIKEDALVTVLWADTTVTNPELRKAAKENLTYYGRQFSIITDSNVVLYKQSGDEYVKTPVLLHRGDVLTQMKSANSDGYFPVTLPDDTVTYFIYELKGFRQFEEGMRFPVEGVVITDDAWLLTFDTASKRFEKFEYLPPGTRYIYEITKDQHYINIWSAKLNKPVSGAFSEEFMKIIQREDHLIIMKKYKTTFERLFKQS